MIGNLSNSFMVTQYMDISQIPAIESKRIAESQNILIYGMWLEGAQWNPKSRCLTDDQPLSSHEPFPVIEVEVN